MSVAASAGGRVVTAVNQIIVVKPAEPQIQMRLPANPATGYQWVLIKYDAALMEQPVSYYVAPHNGVAGAPGYTVWQFHFKKTAFAESRKTTVILEYKRPWETSPGQQQVIQIQIQPE